MAGPGDIVGPFVIRELTGEQRELRLSGRALPHRPYNLEGDQRAEFTWYAGSPVATVQPLGAQEMDTTIRGRWSDRFIVPEVSDPAAGPPPLFDTAATVSGRPIENVRELANLMDDIRRKGQQIEVTWMHIARRGLLKKFRQSWTTLLDVEWEVIFKWNSQADEQGVTTAKRQDDLNDVSDQTSGEALRLDTASAPALGIPIEQGFADSINQSVNDIQSAAVEIGETLVNFIDGVVAPLDAAQRFLGLLDFVRGEAQFVIDVADSTVSRQIQAVDKLSDVASISLGQIISSGRAVRELVRVARRNKHRAARNRIRVARIIDPDIISVFFARDGDDLRNVSLEFYGTQNEWQRIRRFNNLRDARLSAGQVVLVPERSSR